MNHTRNVQILRYTVYALLLFVLFILQTVPGLFVLLGAKPVWVIPAAIAIAMMEGEFIGGIYGAVAGLLCDLNSFLLFGFHGFFVCLCCIAAGLLIIHLMHCNVWGAMLYTSLTMLLCRGVEYFFAYGMWGYENAWKIFAFQMAPVILYTVAVTPLLYLLVHRLYHRFENALRDG